MPAPCEGSGMSGLARMRTLILQHRQERVQRPVQQPLPVVKQLMRTQMKRTHAT